MAFHIRSSVEKPEKLFGHVWCSPPSMEFSRQEYQSGLPFPSPGDLPNPGIESRSSALQADTLSSEPPGEPTDTRMRLSKSRHIKIEKAINYNLICWFFGGKFNPKAWHFGAAVKVRASKGATFAVICKCYYFPSIPIPHSMPLRLQNQTRCPSKAPYQSPFSLLHLFVFSLFFLSICKIYRGTGWYDGRTLGSGAPQTWIWILDTNVPITLGFPWQYLSILRLFSSTVRDNRNIIWLSEAWE